MTCIHVSIVLGQQSKFEIILILKQRCHRGILFTSLCNVHSFQIRAVFSTRCNVSVTYLMVSVSLKYYSENRTSRLRCETRMHICREAQSVASNLKDLTLEACIQGVLHCVGVVAGKGKGSNMCGIA